MGLLEISWLLPLFFDRFLFQPTEHPYVPIFRRLFVASRIVFRADWSPDSIEHPRWPREHRAFFAGFGIAYGSHGTPQAVFDEAAVSETLGSVIQQ